MLNIKDLKVKVAGKNVLKGISLDISGDSIHALMGENGSGKSTLAQTIMGNPSYEVISGRVVFEGNNILKRQTGRKS